MGERTQTPHGDWNSVDELVGYAAYTIDEFWRSQFAYAGIPYQPSMFSATTRNPLRGVAAATEMNNAFYCPTEHGIAY
ncbi:MAG: hypothetical protein R2911_21640 [Caldilineaceae bacterium]